MDHLEQFLVTLKEKSPSPELITTDLAMPANHKESGFSEYDIWPIVENLPIGLFRVTVGGKILYVNQALVEMLHYPDRETLMATPAGELFENRELGGEIFQEVLKNSNVLNKEALLKTYDGSVIWSESNIQVYPGQDGQTAYLGGSIQDITRRKEYETDLHKKTRRLDALASISVSLRKAQTQREMLPILLIEAMELVSANFGAILLLSEGRIKTSLERLPDGNWLVDKAYPGDHPFHEIIAMGGPLFCQPYISHRERPCRVLCENQGKASGACLPLNSEDATLGLLHFAFTDPCVISSEEQSTLIAISEIGGNALRRAGVLESIEQRITERTNELSLLYAVSSIASQSNDIHEVLKNILPEVMKATNAAAGAMHLVESKNRDATMVCHRGLFNQELEQLDNQVKGKISRLTSPLNIDNMEDWLPLQANEEALTQVTGDKPPRFSSLVQLPLGSKSGLMGYLSIFGPDPRQFSLEKVAMLATVAEQIGITIDRARLRQEAEDALIMKERQRLAQALHDSVTQWLYSLVLFSGGWQMEQNPSPEEVKGWLARTSEISHQALREMRLLLYELRPSTMEQDGLEIALRRRLEAVEKKVGLKVDLDIVSEVHLPTEIEKEIYLIAQEALNNVLKHSNATQVAIRITQTEDAIDLTIMDNGCGFEPNAPISSSGMGLSSMRERATRIEALLTILSTPGNGVKIHLHKSLEGSPWKNQSASSL